METQPAPRPIPSPARGTPAGEARFVLDAAALAAAVLADCLYNFLACTVFLILFRGRTRRRMRRPILRADARGAAALLLAAALSVLGGCANQGATETGDTRTFQGQVQQLRWSTRTIIDQSDSPKSLEDDLRAFRDDPNWKEQLRFSAEGLFLMPDGP
jgi:hypothetical protein